MPKAAIAVLTVAVAFGSHAALAQGGGKPTDPQIAHIAYTAGQIDIKAAELARKQSKSKEVRAFANDMLRDHKAVNAQALALVKKLNVKPEEVLEMETRLAGGDVALEPQGDDDGEDAYAPIAYLADESNEPTRVIESRRRDALSGDGIARALDALDARSRRIVEERWLKVNDDTSGGMTLHELAAEYGVSAERIRQIEVAAMKKMRGALETHAA